MEKDVTEDHKPSIGIVLQSLGTRLINTKKYILIPAFVLLGIWFVGRGLEAMTRNPVFEPALIYWIMGTVFGLLVLYAILSLAQYVYCFISSKDRKYTILAWVCFALLIAGVVFTFRGYDISSKGFFALAAGYTEPAQQALVLLFKSNPATPVLPLQLIASEFSPGVVNVKFIYPFAWEFPVLFIFFVWSLLYGSFLLMFQGNKALKVIHLFLALVGVFLMMALKSVFGFTDHQLILLHAGAVVLLFIQVLLTYASLRYSAANKITELKNTSKPAGLLPPSALSVALVIIFLLPLLADIENQMGSTLSSKSILKELTTNPKMENPQYVIAAQISVRSGPALGDEVVGVLQKGTRVFSLKEMHGWVCIGENRWVSSKFLVPVKKG
jgi:hypothetical protein